MTTRIHRAIWREAVRVRRSAIPSFTPLLAVGIGAVIGGFFLLAFRYPDLVRDIGLREDAGWAGLVEFTAEVAIAAGLLLFCWIAIWLFIKELARKPGSERLTSRWIMIAAILIAALHWSVLFVVEIAVIGLAFGAAISVANLSPIGSQR